MTSINPRLDMLVQRAATLLGAEEAATATPILEEVIRAAPARPDALHLLGRALMLQQRWPDALNTLRRAVRAAPANAEALADLAETHEALGNPAMAANALADALRAQPLNPRLVVLHANRLHDAGDANAALAFLQSKRRDGVNDPRVLSGLAGFCRTLRRHAEGIDAARAAIADPATPVGVRRNALFHLGHLLDDTGEYDAAFDAFSRGNATLPERPALDAEAWIDNWSADRLAAVPMATIRDNLPLLVVGLPRSGTTITEQILAAHPSVATVGECETLGRLAHGAPASLADQAAVDAAATAYLARLRSGPAARGRSRVVDKMPENCFLLGFVARVLPGARVVHCTRDARDTCLSCYFQDFGPRVPWSRRLATCAAQYLAYRRVMAHFASACDLAMLEWPNEALSADAEPRIAELLAFAGLSPDDRCLRFAGSRSAVRTASTAQVREGVAKARPPRWKNYERHLGPMLDALASY